MQAEQQQQPWKINVYARSKNFKFRFKSTRALPIPSWKFHRLSLLLRLRRFVLRVKSESPARQRPSLKSKFLTAFEKLGARQAKKSSVAAKRTLNPQYPETKSPSNHLRRLAYEEPVRIGSLFVGVLAFLFGSVSEKVLSSVVLLCITMLLKKYVSGKATIALVFSVVAATAVFHVNSFKNYDRFHGYMPEFARKVTDFICYVFL